MWPSGKISSFQAACALFVAEALLQHLFARDPTIGNNFEDIHLVTCHERQLLAICKLFIEESRFTRLISSQDALFARFEHPFAIGRAKDFVADGERLDTP